MAFIALNTTGVAPMPRVIVAVTADEARGLRAGTRRGDVRVLPGAAAGDRERIRHAKGDEAFVGQSSECGVHRAERCGPPSALLDVVLDGDGVRVVAEALERREDKNLELTE